MTEIPETGDIEVLTAEVFALREIVGYLLANAMNAKGATLAFKRFPESLMERLDTVLPPDAVAREAVRVPLQAMLDRVNAYGPERPPRP
jgi:hypothetical protein